MSLTVQDTAAAHRYDAVDEAGVVVTCPFITAWVGRHPEYADRVKLR